MANSQIVQSVRDDEKQVRPLAYFCPRGAPAPVRVALDRLDDFIFADGAVWIILCGVLL